MKRQAGRVEDEFLTAFAATDSLDAFRQLPLVDQESFFRWIEKAPDEESRWRRIDALVLAMRISCLRLEGHLALASDSMRSSSSPTSDAGSIERAALREQLEDPELFEILENVIDEFLRAREDGDVHETLAISATFIAALREAKCLDLFRRLPAPEQARFLRWIGTTSPITLREKRTETFISALLESPMKSTRNLPT